MRRLMVIAYEDIGLANPAACAHTVAAVQAADQLGFPEARIPLADAVIELALSPKSNSGISAIDAALTTVRDGHFGDIPADIKDAHYQGAAKLGHGVGYDFPHDHPGDWVAQQYLPDAIKSAKYYEPKTNGRYETALAQQYEKLLKANERNR
ncbi:hypothetical protein TUA1478L_24570 [Lactiplantibacillus plantarum]|jgi:putative ATPase